MLLRQHSSDHLAQFVHRDPQLTQAFIGTDQVRFREALDPISVGAVEIGVVLHGVQPLVILIETECPTPVANPRRGA